MSKTNEHGKIDAASAYWIPFIVVVVIWLFAYLLIEPVRTTTNIVFGMMREDPNIIIAFVGLIFMFIGWSFLEFTAIKTVHIARYHDEQMFMVVRAVRIVTVFYPIILVVCRYVTIYSFADWPLYIFALVIFLPMFVLILKTGWFSQPASDDARIEIDLDRKKVYIPVQLVLVAAFTFGPLFIILVSYFTQANPWVVDFVENVLVQLLINPVFLISWIMLVMFTIAYPCTAIIAWKSADIMKLVITNDTKRAIKKVRWYMILFVIVLTLSKLLPLALPALTLFEQGNLLYSAISGGLVAAISVLQTLIITARSKILQKKVEVKP